MDSIRITSYFARFQCTLCGECCRGGWRIAVNENRLDDYRFVSPGFDPVESDDRGWKIRCRSDGSCPLLDNRNQCILHREKGLSALGDVCRSYPRSFIRTQQGIDAGLTFSCPAALDLLFEDDWKVTAPSTGLYRDYIPSALPLIELPDWYPAFEDQIINPSHPPHRISDVLNLSVYLQESSRDSAAAVLSADPELRSGPVTGLMSLLADQIEKSRPGFKTRYPQLTRRALYRDEDFYQDDLTVIRSYLQNQVFLKTVIPESSEDLAGFLVIINQLIAGLTAAFRKENSQHPLKESIQLIEKNIMHSDRFRRRILSQYQDWYP